MKKRLAVDLDLWLHKQISQVAGQRKVTITKWVLRAILEKMIRDKDLKEVIMEK